MAADEQNNTPEPTKADEILRNIENESKKKQAELFKNQARAILEKKRTAETTLRILDEELLELREKFEKGLLT